MKTFKKNRILFLLFCLCCFSLLAACEQQPEITEPSPIHGQWKGQVSGIDITLDIFDSPEQQQVLFSSPALLAAYLPTNCDFSEEPLVLQLPKLDISIEIRLSDQQQLLCKMKNSYSLLQREGDPQRGEVMDGSPTLEHRLTLLRQFSEFSGDETEIPFTYDLFSREGCSQTIERYDLDNQMEGLNDLELILALLDWTGSHFYHNGYSQPPWPITVDSLVNYCETHEQSVNCHGLAQLLAGLLRAYGIKAKIIYCLPVEQPFSDCHVVVHAYSNQLNQWILLDPSYRAVFFDENGDYLDLPHLRQAYIEGRSDKITTWEKFHHPNSPETSLQHWLDYMAKNTFRFCCFIPNTPTPTNDWQTQIELVPDGYHSHSVDAVTSDAGAFWALP